MKNKSLVASIMTAALLASLTAEAIGNGQIFVPGNKMVEAWQDSTLGPASGPTRLPMSPEREANFDFEKAARWNPLQVEFSLKSYQHILKNGFSKTQSNFGKALGLLGVTVGYNYEVEPSFNQGLFTRSDKFFVSPSMTGKTTISEMADDSVVARLMPGYDVEFAFHRQFANPKEAILAAPYFDQNLPFNSERTLQGLKEGDLFTFKARLDIVTDLSYLSSLGLGNIAASAGPHFIVTGGFEVHVLRLPDNKARVKVLGLRRQGGGVKGNIGLEGLKILGVQFLDDKIVELALDSNIVTAKFQRNLNRLFAADYVIDLNDRAVADAFDQAMAQARSFEYLDVVDPRIKSPKIKEKVLSNFKALEELARQDQGKGLVARLFYGGNKSTSNDFKLKIGNKLIGLGNNTRTSTNEIQATNEAGVASSYRLKTKKKDSDFSFFYSLYQTKNRSQVSTVSEGSGDQLTPLSFVISTERSDAQFTVAELKRTREKLKANLGPSAENIDFSQWLQKSTLNNVVVRTQVIMTAEAIQALPAMTGLEIEKAYLNYLSNLNVADRGVSRGTSRSGSFEHRQAEGLKSLRTRLAKVTSGQKSLDERIQALDGLRGNAIFRATGAGFLLSLLTEEQVKSLVRIDVELSSTDGQQAKLGQGPTGPKDLYTQLIYTENLTNDDELELRLESETLK